MLSESEKEVVRLCVVAVAKGDLIGSWEIPIRTGYTQEELHGIATTWSERDYVNDDEFLNAINNCLNEICHGVRISYEELQSEYGIARNEAKRIFEKWQIYRADALERDRASWADADEMPL